MEFPDVNGIISSINSPISSKMETKQGFSHPDIITDEKPRETLWAEFKTNLNADPIQCGRKPYYIDCDLIDTISQCDFDGNSRVRVINAIIRTFLEANIDHLMNIVRKKFYTTIIDKYESKGNNS